MRLRLGWRMLRLARPKRMIAGAGIALVCAGLGIGLWAGGAGIGPVRMLDEVFYDTFYGWRAHEPQFEGDVVIVAIDEYSLDALDKWREYGWPWPRFLYGQMAGYLKKAGARAVVFDLLFDRPSIYNDTVNKAPDDDVEFAKALNATGLPVILAAQVDSGGKVIAPQVEVKDKTVGAANVSSEGVVRQYNTKVRGHDSLALATLRRLGVGMPGWVERPFGLHYYGPHDWRGKVATFRYVSAARLLKAALEPSEAQAAGIEPGMFRGKIVVLGTIAAGTYDLKSAPVQGRYPGTEIHATAIANMLQGRRVLTTPIWVVVLVTLAGCGVSVVLTLLPARMTMKVLGTLAGPGLVFGVSLGLFMTLEIRWLAPGGPMLGALACGISALGYSYFTEFKQRQFVQKALSNYISREVAEEVLRNPDLQKMGGRRREMTVMFSDLANFTTMSEAIGVERLETVLRLYLGEMSQVILEHNGTLDKYIGDSIMSFWNAPAPQEDHARRACLSALAMMRLEEKLHDELVKLAGRPVHSRWGINSGPMIVGNMGSKFLFDYTVLGDAVNLASRLEGANKLYGTKVLVSHTTAELVREEFVLRKVDLLKVKGKTEPMAVYELVCEGRDAGAKAELLKRFGEAFELYQARRFGEAHEMLINLAGDYPEDGPTATLLGRVLVYLGNPPGEDWDGAFVAKDK